jgi:hypothetical protein
MDHSLKGGCDSLEVPRLTDRHSAKGGCGSLDASRLTDGPFTKGWTPLAKRWRPLLEVAVTVSPKVRVGAWGGGGLWPSAKVSSLKMAWQP